MGRFEKDWPIFDVIASIIADRLDDFDQEIIEDLIAAVGPEELYEHLGPAIDKIMARIGFADEARTPDGSLVIDKSQSKIEILSSVDPSEGHLSYQDLLKLHQQVEEDQSNKLRELSGIHEWPSVDDPPKKTRGLDITPLEAEEAEAEDKARKEGGP